MDAPRAGYLDQPALCNRRLLLQASVTITHPAPELNGGRLAIPVQGLFGMMLAF
jgi:hypothetical protein